MTQSNDEDNKQLSNIIRNIRTDAGLTQASLENLLFAANQTIGHIEAGRASKKTVLDVVEAILRNRATLQVSQDNIVRLEQSVKEWEDTHVDGRTDFSAAYPLTAKDVRNIRTFLGYSQIEMAIKMRVSQGTLSRWESETDPYGPKPIHRAKLVYLGAAKVTAATGKIGLDAENELYKMLEAVC